MKKGYQKLCILESIMIIFSIIILFFEKIYTSYIVILFLLLMSFFFQKILRFEPHKKNKEDKTNLEILVFLVTFLLLYFLSGIIIGYIKNGNYYTLEGFFKTILPITLYIIIRERLRYDFLKKREKSKLMTIISILTFLLLDIVFMKNYLNYKNKYSITLSLLLTIPPLCTSNLINSYLCKKSSYHASILYSVIIEIYPYLCIVLPNMNIYMKLVINTLLPVLLWVSLSSFYDRAATSREVKENNFMNLSILLPPSIIVIVLVYFFSGYFRYHMVAIGSNSMSPTINKGDIVIVNQKLENKELEVGEVIVYKKNNHILIHRIVEKTKWNGTYFYNTKGDQVKDIDSYQVEESEIIGRVHLKIGYLGYPTIWYQNSKKEENVYGSN